MSTNSLASLTRRHPNKKSRQIGRGTTRGKTAGRGTKGQRARAGNKMRPELRDIIKKLPKRRGYGKNRARGVVADRVRSEVINLDLIEKHFEPGGTITPIILAERNLVRRQAGKTPSVKILGRGEIMKSLTISGCFVSVSAKTKIEKAGGKVM